MRIKPYPAITLFKLLLSSSEALESAYSIMVIEIERTKVNLKSANFAPQGGPPDSRLPHHCQPQGWHLAPHLG